MDSTVLPSSTVPPSTTFLHPRVEFALGSYIISGGRILRVYVCTLGMEVRGIRRNPRGIDLLSKYRCKIKISRETLSEEREN